MQGRCSGAMPPTPAQRLMARETRVRFGPAPRALDDEPEVPELNWQLGRDRFLMRGAGSHWFYYCRGEGITVERGPGARIEDEALFLRGGVYAAIASINGLLPIHASAVAHGGMVHAFTGPAGAGKSTLTTALGAHGLPMFCDDTLVLDLSDPDRIWCLPGHKRLKLTEEAIALTGARQQEKVSELVDKFYALPPAGDVAEVLPLARLVFLEEGARAEILPVAGAERLMRMRDEHYTAWMFAAARRTGEGSQWDSARQFAHFTRLARQIEMARFVRPRDTSRFQEGVALAAEYVIRSANPL